MNRSPSLRVLMTADPISGVWPYALDLAAGLQDYHVHVVLATLGAPLNVAQQAAVRALPNVRLEEGRYRLAWMPEPWADVDAAGGWLLEMAQRHQVQLVHLNHLVHANLPFGVPVLTVVHGCVLSWWEAVRQESAPAYYDRYRDVVRHSLQGATTVVTPSHAMARHAQRHYGPLPDVVVLHHASARHGCAPLVKAPRVFSAGPLWNEANNVAALLQAAPQLPWPVYLAGADRPPNGILHDGLAASGARRRDVRLLGSLSQAALARELRRTAIYALPARYEPIGLSVLNAAKAECALVLGDVDTLRELWDGAAVFVPPDDEAALVRAIRSLIADPARRTGLGQAARQRAMAFSYERFVQEYLVTYRTCVQARAASSNTLRRSLT